MLNFLKEHNHYLSLNEGDDHPYDDDEDNNNHRHSNNEELNLLGSHHNHNNNNNRGVTTRANKASLSLIVQLPDDTLVNIFSFLSVDTILNVSLVCRNWFELTELNVFWKPIFEKAIFNSSIPRYVLYQHRASSWWKTIQERFDFSERMIQAPHAAPPILPVTVPTTTAANNNNNNNNGDDIDDDDSGDENGGDYNSNTSLQISKRGRRQLYDMINRLVYEKYYKGQSTQYLHHLSTPLYYKTCYYYLHGYQVVGTRRYVRQQEIQRKAARYNETCTTCGMNYLLYAVVPLSTLFFTLFMIALLLKETVGVPEFVKQMIKEKEHKDGPKINVNQHSDLWWFPVFLPFFAGLALWYILLLQVNVKHFVRYLSHIRQNYKIVSYAIIVFAYFTSVIMFSVLGMLALMFPYDKKASIENCKWIWLRKISHNDLLLLSPIVAGIILVNFIWPLLQFIVFSIRRRGNCISVNCLRKSVFQLFVYGGGIICLIMFIAVMISNYTETEQQKEKGGSKLTYLFQNLAFVPLYLIQIAIVGLFMFLFYRLWYSVPLAVRFKVRVSCSVLAVLIVLSTAMLISFELLLAIRGLSVYLLIPLIPLPTALCSIFYTILYLKIVLFG